MRSRWHDMWIYLAAIILAMALASNAYGQDAIQQEEDKITYKKKMNIDFSETAIEGELTKPEGSYLGVRKNIKFKNFIKIRSNFRDKFSDSSDNI